MELRLPSYVELVEAYQRDFKRAFPPAELKPLENIMEMCEKGAYSPWCLFDGDEIVGECFMWLGRPGWGLLDYLCVPEAHRNRGLGAILLKKLQEAEPGMVILGESEAPEHAPDPPLAERRLGFYARSKARLAGYDTELFGVHYKTICWAEPLPEEAEILKKHQEIYLRQFGREKYSQYIQIPLLPGERPRPLIDWAED